MTDRGVRGAGWMAEPVSTLDPVGQVLYRDGRVFRGIRAAYADDAREIVDLALRHGWFDAGLIDTSVTTEQLDEFPLVLEHTRAPFVTYRGEWPAEALRDAATCYVNLARTLHASGWGLKDSHPWNVLFLDGQPRVVDFGSIRPLAEIDWAGWWEEYFTYFLAPLLMFAAGETVLARRMTREHVHGVGTWLVQHRREALMPPQRMPDAAAFADPDRALATLADVIGHLVFPHQASEWTAYPQPASAEPALLRLKDRIVSDVLARTNPATVLDIGTNRGLHAGMAAARGARVLAADIDEACLDDVHRRGATARAPLQAVYLDVVWPEGSGGAFGTMPDAHARLRCETVLCMAVMHHVCVRQQFAPAAFIDGVAAFSGEGLVLEFIPFDDVHVAQWPQMPPPGYATEAVHDALLGKFARVHRTQSEPDPRVIFICEGRRS